MRRTIIVAVSVTALTCASGCRKPDKGSVAALEADGETVIADKKCKKKGETYDYVSCGKELRAEMRDRICAERGPGKHEYLYRTGTSKPIKQTVICD